MIISQSCLENRYVDYTEFRLNRFKDVLAQATSYYLKSDSNTAIKMANSAHHATLLYIMGSYDMACRIGSDHRGLEELDKRRVEATEEANVLYGTFVEKVRRGSKKGGVENG